MRNGALTVMVLMIMAAAAVLILVQHQENGRLVREVAEAHDEVTRARGSLPPSNPEPASQSGESKRVQEMEAELVRLRGAVTRAGQAEAELAQLKSTLERRGAPVAGSGTDGTAAGSDALVQYLGTPVEVPANLDPAYTREGLLGAVQLAAQKAGVALKKVDVDNSEFPFLAGVTCEENDWEKLKNQLRNLDGYEYSGSVGSHTSYAFSLVPSRAFPPDAAQRIGRRTTARLQLFQARLQGQEN